MKKLLWVVILASLAACSSAGDEAAQTVERYLRAKINSDEQTIAELLCAEQSDLLAQEVASFATIDARIEGMACVKNEDDTVTCDGAIIAVYGAEETRFPLATYRVVQEADGWKWCGEVGS